MRIKLLAGLVVAMWIFYFGVMCASVGHYHPAFTVGGDLVFGILLLAFPNVMLAGHLLGWWNLDK